MLTHTSLFAAIVVAVVGTLIFWSNPRRPVNRATFSCSLHIALWLWLLDLAVHDVHWLPVTCGVSAWVPLHFWIVKEIIAASPGVPGLKELRGGWAWVLASVLLTALCCQDVHSFAGSLSYQLFNGGVLLLYALLFFDAFRTIRRLTGAPRLELQIWLGGGCAMAFGILVLLGLKVLTHDRIYIRMQPLVVLTFYAATVLAITNNRIFEARQIFMVGLEKTLLVAASALFGYGGFYAFSLLLPRVVAVFATTGAVLLFALVVDRWLERFLQLFPRAQTIRQAAFDVVRTEARVEKLEQAFVGIVKGWGQTDDAMVLHSAGDALRGGGVEVPHDSEAIQTLKQLRWATPERLARERTTHGRESLAKFLSDHRLGIAVTNDNKSLDVVVGAGITVSRRPYTFLHVTQLSELMSIFEGAFERASLSAKAQHAEQLATVGLLGASLAHEIRNPLVSIKTFVQLLPTRHNEPAFRDKFFHLMKDEVARIDRLTEQLLDLASPRSYSGHEIPIHAIIKTTLELVSGKASDRNVKLVPDLNASPDTVFSDESAVTQVLLNLCLNAIQAMEDRPGERWIRVATQRVDGMVELSVADSGPGISPQIQARLFQPFQSTKSSGFGLGLAICRDILANLDATIAVDPPEHGKGATFRVNFPCRHPSS